MTEKTFTGTAVSAEFVGPDRKTMSGEEADPGTYVTIRMDDSNAQVGAGRVTVTWK